MFGERLKKAREAAGKSQAEIARAIGVSQPAYSYMENGEKNPSLPVAKQLAVILDVSLDYLMDNKPSESAESDERLYAPAETVANQPDNSRIIISVFDGSKTVECLSVSYDRIQFPSKNEPEYILQGVDRVGFFGEHSVILGWYDDEISVKREMEEILTAIGNREKTYRLKYFTDVRFTFFGTTERK